MLRSPGGSRNGGLGGGLDDLYANKTSDPMAAQNSRYRADINSGLASGNGSWGGTDFSSWYAHQPGQQSYDPNSTWSPYAKDPNAGQDLMHQYLGQDQVGQYALGGKVSDSSQPVWQNGQWASPEQLTAGANTQAGMDQRQKLGLASGTVGAAAMNQASQADRNSYNAWRQSIHGIGY